MNINMNMNVPSSGLSSILQYPSQVFHKELNTSQLQTHVYSHSLSHNPNMHQLPPGPPSTNMSLGPSSSALLNSGILNTPQVAPLEKITRAEPPPPLPMISVPASGPAVPASGPSVTSSVPSAALLGNISNPASTSAPPPVVSAVTSAPPVPIAANIASSASSSTANNTSAVSNTSTSTTSTASSYTAIPSTSTTSTSSNKRGWADLKKQMNQKFEILEKDEARKPVPGQVEQVPEINRNTVAPPQSTYSASSRVKTPVPEKEDDEGEDLGSSEDEDDSEEPETDNLIICTFEKVSRVKNKWKMNLRCGVMNLNGRDYLFHRATGEGEW